MVTKHQFPVYIALMLLCSIISMLANPILYLGGFEIYFRNTTALLYSLIFLISYPLAGGITWKTRQNIKDWWKSAIIASTLSGTILLLLTIIWINTYTKDGMTGLMILSSNFFASLFTAIPVWTISYVLFKPKSK